MNTCHMIFFQTFRHVWVFRSSNEYWYFWTFGRSVRKTELLSMMGECCHLLAKIPNRQEKSSQMSIFSWRAIRQIVKKKNRAFVLVREVWRTNKMWKWTLPVADNNGQQFSVTNKEFKEFYWNKGKFQSQSLMVFRKKRKTCFGF